MNKIKLDSEIKELCLNTQQAHGASTNSGEARWVTVYKGVLYSQNDWTHITCTSSTSLNLMARGSRGEHRH